MSNTLRAFDDEELAKVRLFLATQVTEMLGRKMEEGDWSKVYCAAKGMPNGTWSNLNIDVTHGNLGVEHKMICRRSDQSLLEACGTSIMHPAGTRAIRIPDEQDATKAARNILRQYGDLIEERTEIVRVVHAFNHERLTGDEAVARLRALGMSTHSAKKALPIQKKPIGAADDEPDMRMGWLLWQEHLREFLYFEERMEKPRPSDYTAQWRDSGGGRRKRSRNLWVYRGDTKVFSITTEAGAKIQPYFTVPKPNDVNLYHFIMQGEDAGDGLVRVWLTETTANLLKEHLGKLDPGTIEVAVREADFEQRKIEASDAPFASMAFEILVTRDAYARIQEVFGAASDEQNFRQLLDVLRSR